MVLEDDKTLNPIKKETLKGAESAKMCISLDSTVNKRERAVSGDISSPAPKLPGNQESLSQWSCLNNGGDKSSSSGSENQKRKKGKNA